MNNFLTTIEEDKYGVFYAVYADGLALALSANTYEDAVLEADQIDETEYA